MNERVSLRVEVGRLVRNSLDADQATKELARVLVPEARREENRVDRDDEPHVLRDDAVVELDVISALGRSMDPAVQGVWAQLRRHHATSNGIAAGELAAALRGAGLTSVTPLCQLLAVHSWLARLGNDVEVHHA